MAETQDLNTEYHQQAVTAPVGDGAEETSPSTEPQRCRRHRSHCWFRRNRHRSEKPGDGAEPFGNSDSTLEGRRSRFEFWEARREKWRKHWEKFEATPLPAEGTSHVPPDFDRYPSYPGHPFPPWRGHPRYPFMLPRKKDFDDAPLFKEFDFM